MTQPDRVGLVLVVWLLFWTEVGFGIGRWLDVPGTITATGFVFGLLTVLVWPWVLPHWLNDWMDPSE